MPCFDVSCGRNTFLSDVATGSGYLCASTQKVYTSRYQSPQHFDNRKQVRSEKQFSSARRLFPADLPERRSQVCRVRSSLHYSRQIVSFQQRWIRWNALKNWIPLRIRVRLRNTQGPTLFWQQVELDNLSSCACQFNLSPSPPAPHQITWQVTGSQVYSSSQPVRWTLQTYKHTLSEEL